jgi:hypothetical protein
VRALLVAATVLAGGCFDPRPPAGARCSPSERCPGDLTCVDGFCVSGPAPEPCACSGDARVCGADTTPCPLGCDAAEARCRELVPSNEVTWDQVPPGVGALIVPAGETWVLDTSTGVITAPLGSQADAAVLVRPGQPTIIAAAEVAIDGTLNVTGGATLIFLVTGEVRIAGVLDVSAGCAGDPTCPGPGGSPGGDTGVNTGPCGGGPGGGAAPGVDEGGGAGGGHGGLGGDGGDGSDPPVGDGGLAARTPCGTDALEPLTGGSGGGFGGMIANVREGGRGGGGGGAVQLTSRTRVSIAGAIDAGGAGGQHGDQPGGGSDEGGGGGGGAGGGVLLEAPAVDVTGIVAANGGGGGGGLANDGQDGSRSTDQALGGAASMLGTAGGAGGASRGPAAPGVDRPTGGINAGGGGGGGGRIRINARTRAPGGTFSPPPSTADVRVE